MPYELPHFQGQESLRSKFKHSSANEWTDGGLTSPWLVALFEDWWCQWALKGHGSWTHLPNPMILIHSCTKSRETAYRDICRNKSSYQWTQAQQALKGKILEHWLLNSDTGHPGSKATKMIASLTKWQSAVHWQYIREMCKQYGEADVILPYSWILNSSINVNAWKE